MLVDQPALFNVLLKIKAALYLGKQNNGKYIWEYPSQLFVALFWLGREVEWEWRL